MIRRAILFAIASMALVAAPVAAQDYDGTDASAGVTADGDIAVSGEGFIPNSTVNYQVDYTPFGDENAVGVVGGYEGEIAFGLPGSLLFEIVEEGSTQADANGNVSFEVQGQGEGRYEITMTDGTNTAVAAATVGTAPADDGDAGDAGDTAAAGTGLPTTGSDSSLPLAQLGIVLVMLGGIAIYVAKRRRNASFV